MDSIEKLLTDWVHSVKNNTHAADHWLFMLKGNSQGF
jgi:hypothetical protein